MTAVSSASKIDEYGFADDVDRDERVLGVGEDPLSGARVGARAKAALISSTLVSRPASGGEVDDGAVRHGRAHGEAVRACRRARG